MKTIPDIILAFDPNVHRQLMQIGRVCITDDAHRALHPKIEALGVPEVVQDEGGYFETKFDFPHTVAGIGYEYDEEEGVWWFTFTPDWLGK